MAPGRSPARARLALCGLVVLAIAAGLGLYGLGSGGKFYHQFARAPLRAASDAPYYRDSILHVGLAHLLGLAGSLTAFRVFVLAWWWAALGLLARAPVRPRDLLLLFAVVTTLPAAMIVHAWSGHPDAPTLLLAALLVTARRPWALAGIAALGVWNHLGMWLVLCVEVVVLWSLLAVDRRRGVAVALGLAAGVASHALLFWWSGIEVGTGRFAAAAGLDVATLWSFWSGPGLASVYSLYFAHALWLPALVLALWRWRPRVAVWLIATQVLAWGVTFFTRDTTRVFAVLSTVPLVVGLVLALRHTSAAWLRVALGLGVVITLAAPRFFVWEGRVHTLAGSRAHLQALLRGD